MYTVHRHLKTLDININGSIEKKNASFYMKFTNDKYILNISTKILLHFVMVTI